jgi:membrane protease YdiL (CAAX protease family)
LGYLLLCAFAAGLLAYPLHRLLQGAIAFETLVNRGGELILVLGLIPLSRHLGIHATDIGLPGCRRTFLRQVKRGLLLGVLMLGLHMLLLLALEARTLNYQKLEAMRLLRLAFKGLLIGAAVAAVEEPVFRGFLLGCLLRKVGQVRAVAIASFYFAALHFLDTDLNPQPDEIRWNTGLALVIDAFRHLPLAQADAFFALFAAGALLACVRIWRPWGLGYCIGLHMGWVFVIKTVKPFTRIGDHPLLPGLISQYDGVIGLVSAGWSTLLVGMLLPVLLRRSPYRPIRD